MSGGGGKGGSSTQTIKIDPRLEEGASQTLAAALNSASIPYTPNRGTTIAAQTPAELAAMRSMANDPAQAFGLTANFSGGGLGGVPQPNSVNALGMRGYSTGGLYDEHIAASVPEDIQRRRAEIIAGYADAAERTLAGGKPNKPKPRPVSAANPPSSSINDPNYDRNRYGK